MSKFIAVFGAGRGLGQAVARHYAREGYAVTLVACRSEPPDRLAKDLTSAGATAHVITADLSHTALMAARTGPHLADPGGASRHAGLELWMAAHGYQIVSRPAVWSGFGQDDEN